MRNHPGVLEARLGNLFINSAHFFKLLREKVEGVSLRGKIGRCSHFQRQLPKQLDNLGINFGYDRPDSTNRGVIAQWEVLMSTFHDIKIIFIFEYA